MKTTKELQLKADMIETEEEVTGKVPPMHEVLYGVREGNEYQAMEGARRLNAMKLTGMIENPLQEKKYYLVKTLALLNFVSGEDEEMGQLLHKMEAEFVKKTSDAKTVDECSAVLEDMVKSYCALNEENTKQYSSLVQRIISAVAVEMKAPLTLQYFADALNVNSSYLSNLFRKETGQTITDYVTEKRIHHAAKALRFTKEPVKMVAKQVGIKDVQYFSRLFKKRMGITPTEYRDKFSPYSASRN